MYTPPVFSETRPEIVQTLIAAHPLATLVTLGGKGIDATHVPLLFYPSDNGAGILRGHLARANPQWQNYAADSEALAIFSGAEHYISPNWYPSKQEHGKVVPTWNYAVVHARGPLSFHPDAEWLLENVRALTDAQEKSSALPWRVDDAPHEFIEAALRVIVGVEMRITSLEGKWKMSQNRPAQDRKAVVTGLEALGSEPARNTAALVNEALTRVR